MKAVIFDLDGVLVDTAQYHYQAWVAIAKALDFDLTLAQNEQLKGVSRIDSLRAILEWSGKQIDTPQFEEFLIKKNNHYLSLIQEISPQDALPGVPAFLKALQAHQIPMALGSASKNARPILEKLTITTFFDAIVDGNDVTKSKPDPEVFLMGAAALAVPPENCIVFEDSQAGINAALAANMQAIAVGSPDLLHNATHYITDFDQHPFDTMATFFE